MIRSPAQEEGRSCLEHKARFRVWPGHRSEPQIVAWLRARARGADCLTFRCPPVQGERRRRMEDIFTCCAGLDVHKKSVEACVRRIEPNGRLHSETRHWGTMTRDLVAMADWLAAEGVRNVAMESTGVFWKPIFNILENRFTVLLVN